MRNNEIKRFAGQESTMKDYVRIRPFDTTTIRDIDDVVSNLRTRDSRIVMFPKIDWPARIVVNSESRAS